MNYKPIDNLINNFSQIRGIGKKTSIKLVYKLIEKDEDFIEELSNNLEILKNEISICPICGFISHKSNKCEICSNSNREENRICVVKSFEDILYLENYEIYNGLYHVLGGLISPVKGITPDELKINNLIKRIEINQDIDEIIIALPKTSEGNITSVYIKKIINENHKNINITTLAQGITVESNFETINKNALAESFNNRKSL